MRIPPEHNRATRNISLIALAGGVLLLTTGCGVSVVGNWRMVKAVPNKEVFAIDGARFDRDGRFTASVTIEGKTTRESGTYDFNGFKLKMRPEAGGQRQYNALVRLDRLEVLDGDRKVILKKVPRSRKKESGKDAAESREQ